MYFLWKDTDRRVRGVPELFPYLSGKNYYTVF